MTGQSAGVPSGKTGAASTWRWGGRQGVEEKRDSLRVSYGEAAKAYNVDKISARILTEQREYTGSLLDLSAGGLCMLIPAPLPLNMQIRVELKIGPHVIKAQGVVKNRHKLGVQYRLGVQFTNLPAEEEGFLQLLYGPGGSLEEVDGLSGK